MPRHPKDSPPRDPQQVIEDQAQRIERLEEDLRRSEIERNRLRRENERLKEELEMARRRATRQAAQVLASILRTAQQRGLNTTAVLGAALQAPRPVVLDAFQQTMH